MGTILNNELLTPPGKLKSEFAYQSKQGRFVGRSAWYYNREGQVILTVGFNADLDTSGVNLYDYDIHGNQIALKYYDKILRQFQRTASHSYSYNDTGKLISVFSGIEVNSRRMIYTNYYNEDGLLVLTQFGADQRGEKYVYEHDDKNRISKFSWLVGGESPIMEYFYRYKNNGQLEAKETWSRGEDSQSKEDAFHDCFIMMKAN